MDWAVVEWTETSLVRSQSPAADPRREDHAKVFWGKGWMFTQAIETEREGLSIAFLFYWVYEY